MPKTLKNDQFTVSAVSVPVYNLSGPACSIILVPLTCSGPDSYKVTVASVCQIDDCGFTSEFVGSCRSNPCTLHYLAPSDYHCYHSPVDGTVSYLNLLTQGRYSMTVKPYIFGSTNILRRNRRAVLVIDCGSFKVGMIIIGGVTVDSIRLDELVKVGAVLRKGQRVGAFARGGSSIAMFFSGPVVLDSWAADVVASGKDFKLDCGQDLASQT